MVLEVADEAEPAGDEAEEDDVDEAEPAGDEAEEDDVEVKRPTRRTGKGLARVKRPTRRTWKKLARVMAGRLNQLMEAKAGR